MTAKFQESIKKIFDTYLYPLDNFELKYLNKFFIPSWNKHMRNSVYESTAVFEK